MKTARWIIGLVVLTISLWLVACDGYSPTREKALVDNVEIQMVPGAPSQYNAVVTGQFPDTCTRMGRTRQVKMLSTIKITMYTVRPEGVDCPPIPKPFKEKVRLDVSGLAAGSYAVEVNGVTASLTLEP